MQNGSALPLGCMRPLLARALFGLPPPGAAAFVPVDAVDGTIFDWDAEQTPSAPFAVRKTFPRRASRG